MTDPDGDGVYDIVLRLLPGEYQYKFVVDGRWYEDPASPNGAPDGFGGRNSVLVVRPSGNGTPAAARAQNHPAYSGKEEEAVTGTRFTYRPPSPARFVYLAGQFNNWSETGDRMFDTDGDGIYEIVLRLPPGEYQYKFVVDGQWHGDPDNPRHAPDGFGGQNSIILVGTAERER